MEVIGKVGKKEVEEFAMNHDLTLYELFEKAYREEFPASVTRFKDVKARIDTFRDQGIIPHHVKEYVRRRIVN